MKINFLKILFLLITIVFSLAIVSTPFVEAQSEEEKLETLNKQIQEYESEVSRLRSQANTLSNQIAQFDAQIRLTTLKIQQIEERILALGGRIDRLEVSLDALGNAFDERVEESYKMSRVTDPVYLILSADGLNEAISRYHYLKRLQEADRDLMHRLTEVKTNYVEEKEEQELLQEELEEQNQVLGTQKAAKDTLLSVTKSDEKRYQELLSKARAELAAIQAIIAGRGDESEVGGVGTGARIASVIPGASPCSSGGHLHLEVAKDGINHNPASYLSNNSVDWDNGPDSPFAFTGGWPWPLNNPVRITQGYGMTYYAANLRYYGGSPHTGIDMVNNGDYTVKAVADGTLYRGAISCGGGLLKYVRIKHNEGGLNTYYLHVNY